MTLVDNIALQRRLEQVHNLNLASLAIRGIAFLGIEYNRGGKRILTGKQLGPYLSRITQAEATLRPQILHPIELSWIKRVSDNKHNKRFKICSRLISFVDLGNNPEQALREAKDRNPDRTFYIGPALYPATEYLEDGSLNWYPIVLDGFFAIYQQTSSVLLPKENYSQ